MTIDEFVDKYAQILYEKNTQKSFEEVCKVIDGLTYNGKPITLEKKIEIWKKIKEKIVIFESKKINHFFEHENQGILNLISLTLKSLENDKVK